MGYRQIHADGGLGSVSGVVSSLPAGYTLGEVRRESNKEYRLVYNAGGATISPGYFATPVKGGAGPHSMTVTTTSKTFAHVGAVLCHNATATTGTYFWGLTKGASVAVSGDTASIATGNGLYIAADGQVAQMPSSVPTGNICIGWNINTIITAATTGTAYINLL